MTHLTHVQTNNGWEEIPGKISSKQMVHLGRCATDGDIFMSTTTSGDINIYKGRVGRVDILSIFKPVKRFLKAKEVSLLPILESQLQEDKVRLKQVRFQTVDYFKLEGRIEYTEKLIRTINLMK